MATLAMNAPAAVSFRVPALPWALQAADERRFKRIVRDVALVVVVLVLLIWFVPLKPPERVEAQPLPAPMARLLIEQQRPAPPPPAPPAAVAEAPRPEAEKAAAPDKPEAIKPVEPARREQPAVTEARQPRPDAAPGEAAVANARRKASGVGLLAMKDQLAELHSAPAAAQLKQDIAPGPGVGTGQGAGVGAGTQQGVPLRAMITSNATGGSGGVNTAAYSRDTGGGGLAGRGSTLVEGVAGGGGGGGAGGGGGRAGGGRGGDGSGAGGTLTRAASGKASRSLEDVKLVFERHKGAIYAIYNRALRDNPSLAGKVVLELKIAPSGEVSALRIVSSELKDEALEGRLVARIRSFDFGAKDVETLVVTWPVDFLPS